MMAVVARRGAPPQDVRALLARAGWAEGIEIDGVHVVTWGLPSGRPRPGAPLRLATTNHSDDGPVPDATLAAWLEAGDLARLASMLPPFAALGVCPDGLRLATDSLGFRPVYRATGPGWTAVSTSAIRLGRLRGRGPDHEAVMLQSQLGWQLGEHTLFDGVTALAPGESLVLTRGGVRSEFADQPAPRPGSITLAEGVTRAAAALTDVVAHHLEVVAHPVLQLTGGQDSRIVLSAVPRGLRSRITAMTLDVPGTADARVAADIAARHGMRHDVRRLEGLAGDSAAAWFDRVLATAVRHDAMADPVARSVTGWAEESLPQGPRLSGLGGEVARGFYYTGPVRPSPVTRRRAETLARWRMLANEAVSPEALAPPYRGMALPVACEVVHTALLEAGPEWFTATDELYLHRVRRWGGLGESAVTFSRTLTNPMLDHRFVDVARALSPRSKHRGRFLGALQVALDPELADLPLDDRPSPRALASGTAWGTLRLEAGRARKLGRKVRQRLARSGRPLPGAAIVARKVVEHLRHVPTLLDPVRSAGLLDEVWLDHVVGGSVQPRPADVALLVNLLAAAPGHEVGA